MWKSQQKITIHIYSVLILLVNTEDINLSRLDGLEIKNIILKYLSEDRQEVVLLLVLYMVLFLLEIIRFPMKYDMFHPQSLIMGILRLLSLLT